MRRLAKALLGLGAVGEGVRQVADALDGNREQRRIEGARQIGNGRMRKATVRNLDERVAFIKMQAQKGREDPRVREFAEAAITKRCGDRWCIAEGDYAKEVQAVFFALRKRVRYVLDPYKKDMFKHPATTLTRSNGADCDDTSSLLAACLGSVGYPCKFRVIQQKGAPTWNHIYVLVGLPPNAPNKWVPLDLTVPKPPGWEPPKNQIERVRDFDVF